MCLFLFVIINFLLSGIKHCQASPPPPLPQFCVKAEEAVLPTLRAQPHIPLASSLLSQGPPTRQALPEKFSGSEVGEPGLV